MTFGELMLWSKEIALVLFFLTFLAIVAWAFWPGNRSRFQREGARILEEEESGGTGSNEGSTSR
ncbi:MAG: cbb3-type cytochrome c oxidase subunit 3 [Magnetococcales bacterium]|nr:cbb3-type cytochrome c oxidase subunit 3 [Magnetococcales bacterium]